MTNTVASGEQTFYWRMEIKVQASNDEIYNILAVLSHNPQPVSLSLLNELPGTRSPEPGTIVVYVTATDDQVQQVKQSLFEGGAIGVFINKVNNN